MGGHFWEASLFKGPKGGHPPKKIQFFLVILLVNIQIGILSMKHCNTSGVIGLKYFYIVEKLGKENIDWYVSKNSMNHYVDTLS